VTATATRPAPPPAAPPARGGNTLAGTRTLVRFALRRDRVRLPIWIFAIFLGTLGTASNFEQTYADAADRADVAGTMNSPAGLAMTGPVRYLSDYTYGSMLGHQMISFTAVLVGLMGVLTVVRHTRTEEETGRAELVRAGVVGRHAHLTAALIVATLANLLLGLLLLAGLSGFSSAGYTTSGAVLYGAAIAAVGITFAAVAAVTVQITAHARAASGMALAVVGTAYALRAAGDAAGDGGGSWLAWLSPIGWAQRTYVYVDDRWWPLLLCVLLTAALAAAGYRLASLRDLGAGLRASRLGRPDASEALGRPGGFALRLHRGLLIGFGVGLLLMGAMYGSILGDAEEMFENVDVVQDALAEIGGSSVAESFASMVLIPMSVVAAVYAVMATLRPRSEETSGRAESLLSTGLSRDSWLGAHLGVALIGSAVVMALAGLSLGATAAASTGEGGLFLKLLGASVAYAPALWLTVGITVLLVGWLPRAVVAAWAVPVVVFVIGYLGTVLQFPQWVMNLNPFGHVPRLPAAEMSWTPLVILTAVAALLIWLGLLGFRRRDLDLK
jgi:ABC-2 type transport system permease protein